MDRRKFIQTSAIATAGMLTLPSIFAEAKGKKAIGLQLYTLRDVIMNDVKGTLDKVASWGYTEVETYGYGDGKLFGMPVAEFGAHLKGIGVQVVSGHYGIDLLSNNWDKACADAQSMGQKYVVVPWLDQKYYSSLDELKRTCQAINSAALVAKKYKLRMGYHNHAFEFEPVEGKVMFDVMLDELDPKLVAIEMDLYWMVNANQDPFKYFEEYPGRFELWHVKDMDKNNRENNADVGTGSIDFTKLFKSAKKSGMKKFFVEQETYPSNPMQSVENSIKYLKTIL
ncbi:MAG: sugar phosphate isomerase/epimerase [Flammeovirgaceae bacterium]|jgi:sugar phosphate isomerase/epimerase|nr:sugar phosphate isomerase/epimerase [Flammeovirgaceae bacterium]